MSYPEQVTHGEVTLLPSLLAEADAYTRFPLLEDKELRRAR